ncbi:hypothetical protein V6767_20365 [Martelella sp. FLE1502]
MTDSDKTDADLNVLAMDRVKEAILSVTQLQDQPGKQFHAAVSGFGQAAAMALEMYRKMHPDYSDITLSEFAPALLGMLTEVEPGR